jgi:hypothetical protein
MPSVTGTGVVKVVNGVFQSPATTIVNSDVSASAAIDVSKLAMSTNRILGRTTAGTGAVEEISVGTGLSLSAGTLTNTGIGGSVGAVDNAVLRADVGTGVVQNSSIIIDDETTATQNNVAIRNNDSQTNSALVLTPKGTGAFILGPKPDGTATGGNARGARAVDLQILRASNTQVATGVRSFIGAGQNNTVTADDGVVCGGVGNTANQQGFVGGGTGNAAGVNNAVCGGNNNNTGTANIASFIGGGTSNGATGMGSVSCGGGRNNVGGYLGNDATATISSILGGSSGLADRFGMQAHCSGSFSGTKSGDAQRARFVLRCKTTTNTGVEMALDGATTYLTIPSGKVIFLNIKVVGTKSDGSAVATYERQYAVKNVAATSSEVYAPITIGTDNAAGTTLEVATVDAGDYVRIRPTGITSETWRWVASVDAVEVAYGT